MFEHWIRDQNRSIQLEVFNRIAHHLSNSEIVAVMREIESNRDIVDVHIDLGIIEKYRVDLFRIRQIVTEKWPERVIG